MRLQGFLLFEITAIFYYILLYSIIYYFNSIIYYYILLYTIIYCCCILLFTVIFYYILLYSNIGSSKASQAIFSSLNESYSQADLNTWQQVMCIPEELPVQNIGGHVYEGMIYDIWYMVYGIWYMIYGI